MAAAAQTTTSASQAASDLAQDNATTFGYLSGNTNLPLACLAQQTLVQGTTPSAAFGCCYAGNQCPEFYSACITYGATSTPSSDTRCLSSCPSVLSCSAGEAQCVTFVKTTGPGDLTPVLSYGCFSIGSTILVQAIATPYATLSAGNSASAGAGIPGTATSTSTSTGNLSSTNGSTGQSHNSTTTTIVASVVPTVVGLCLIGLGIFFLLRRRRQKRRTEKSSRRYSRRPESFFSARSRQETVPLETVAVSKSAQESPTEEVTAEQQQRRLEYKTAIFCAVGCESDGVMLHLNATTECGTIPGAYTTGIFAGHKVVLVWLPGSGHTTAAMFATQLKQNFAAIELALIVGVCGGVPQPPNHEEIFLGDLIISTSTVTLDYGRQLDGEFQPYPHTIKRPSPGVRAHLHKLSSEGYRARISEGIEANLSAIAEKRATSPKQRKKQEPLKDELFDAITDKLIPRTRPAQPQVHFGAVASGNTLMRSATHRDEIAAKDNVIAFEMEGAAVAEEYDTLVVKAVCDYADSHKEKSWQPFAADVAAAGARALLEVWRGS